MPSAAGGELPYEEVSSEQFGAAAAATWSFRFDPLVDPDQVILNGPCPRCGHPFEYPWPLVIVREEALLTREPGDDVLDVTVVCRCRSTHPGAGSEAGCGATWTLTVPAP